jgi:hypothetical protein
MQNEETIISISETKIEKEMEGIEEYPSLQIESNKILGVNGKHLQITKEKTKQILEQLHLQRIEWKSSHNKNVLCWSFSSINYNTKVSLEALQIMC